MNRDNVDAISEALGEFYEKLQNTIEQYTVIQLTKHTENPSKWKKTQLKEQKQFDKAITTLLEQFTHKINKPIETAFHELYKDAKEDIVETKEQVKKDDESLAGASAVPLLVEAKIKEYKAQVKQDLTILHKQTKIGYKKLVNDVASTIYRKKISTGDDLYRQVEIAMNKGIKDMYVCYRDGRRFTFKSYEEMNVRTTMQQEALKYQYESAKELGVIFYLCSAFSDCAKDHASFQGRIYYDENWQSMIPSEEIEAVGKFIRDKKLMSIQQVRDNKPYLTTRPNCRHTFKPLTREQAMNYSTGFLLNKFKMTTGKYEAQNYKDLQEQRYRERQVRKFKQERDELELQLKNAPDDSTRNRLRKQLVEKKALISKWQRATRDIVKSNPVLERDYRRENYKTIVQDVGFKYNQDIK